MKKLITALTAAAMLAAPVSVLPTSAESVSLQNEVGCPGVKLSQPKITKISKTSDSVTLVWGKVKNASGYKVFKKVGGRYKVVGVIKGGKTVKYKVKGLKSGTVYNFKVRAYRKKSGKTCWSKYSKGRNVTTKYGLGNGNFSCPKYSVKYYDQVWDVDVSDKYTVTFICKKDSNASITICYDNDYVLEKGVTAKDLAQQAVDAIDAQHPNVHAEMAGEDKIGGVKAYRVHMHGDEYSPVDPEYDMYTAYAVKDRRIMSVVCHIRNDHYEEYRRIMDNIMRTFKFKK